MICDVPIYLFLWNEIDISLLRIQYFHDFTLSHRQSKIANAHDSIGAVNTSLDISALAAKSLDVDVECHTWISTKLHEQPDHIRVSPLDSDHERRGEGRGGIVDGVWSGGEEEATEFVEAELRLSVLGSSEEASFMLN